MESLKAFKHFREAKVMEEGERFKL
jgi:hypothetical protein